MPCVDMGIQQIYIDKCNANIRVVNCWSLVEPTVIEMASQCDLGGWTTVQQHCMWIICAAWVDHRSYLSPDRHC